MTKLRFLTKTDGVAEALRLEILQGSLASGTQLRQDEVAERLGVSPTPVREAFAILEAEGFLDRRPHRGVVVAKADGDDMRDTYEVRGLLEALATQRVVARNDEGALNALERIVVKEGEALRVPDVHRFRLHGVEFHKALVRASASDVLMSTHSLLAKHTVFHPPLDGLGIQRAHREHKQLLAALKRGDGPRAAALARRHMQWNAELVQKAQKVGRRDAGATGEV